MIKIASEQLTIPFTYIYNESIKTGIVMDLFKISRFTPMYKSGAITDPCNYRPISISSAFSKTLERLVYDQLILFLVKKNILFKHQFDFRKGYSTEQAILEITDNLRNAVDSKQVTCDLFLDFSKAYLILLIMRSLLLSLTNMEFGEINCPGLVITCKIENNVNIGHTELDLHVEFLKALHLDHFYSYFI